MKFKKVICDTLLAILNSRFLNGTPCRYEFCGNIDAFSRENLESEDIQQPGITVREVLNLANSFKLCPMGTDSGIAVLEDGKWREGNLWDVHALNQSMTKAAPTKEK